MRSKLQVRIHKQMLAKTPNNVSKLNGGGVEAELAEDYLQSQR